MSKVVSDIEEIVVLARRVHSELEKGSITKAKRELKVIIELDMDELRSIQRSHSNKELLDHVVATLNAAKRALRDLESHQLFEEVKQLMDRIIAIERHELLEAKKDERVEDSLYNCWYKYFVNMKLYHTTSSVFVEEILKHGLDPDRRPEIWEKAEELYLLIKPFMLRPGSEEFLERGLYERRYICLAPKLTTYTLMRVSETIKLLLGWIKHPLTHIKVMIHSNGDYPRYVKYRKDIHAGILTEWQFNSYHPSKLRSLVGRIDALKKDLQMLMVKSRPATLEVDVAGVLSNLPKPKARAFCDYKYFRDVLYPKWCSFFTSDADTIHGLNNSALRVGRRTLVGDELRAYKPIPPRYIHVLKDIEVKERLKRAQY